jgi:hypothetical protein
MSGSDTAQRSPSGLYRMSAWESEMERTYTSMPSWYWDDRGRYTQFTRWVAADAEATRLRLAGFVRAGGDPALREALGRLTTALAHDAEWARGLAGRALNDEARQVPP